VPDPARTVFLSYRREVSWALAQLVFRDLTEHGFDVFMDTASLDSGEFERVILAQIESRAHFLLLLESRSLDRIGEDGDWLRREVSHALIHRRNIVPLLAGGVRVPRAAELPAEVAGLASYNAVSMPQEYVAEAMHKLRERFLRVTELPALRSVPAAVSQGLAALRIPKLSAHSVRMGVQLGWTVVADVDEFELERCRNPEFDYPTPLYRGPARGFVDNRPGPGNDAHYRVRAITDGTAGPWSTPVLAEFGGVAALPARPAADAPPRLTGRREGDAVRLEWTRVWPAAEYQVIRLGPLALGPPPEVVGAEVYRGPELTCLVRLADLSAPSNMVRFCARGLDRRGRAMTDWSEPVQAH
jgi:hypothetical protein